MKEGYVLDEINFDGTSNAIEKKKISMSKRMKDMSLVSSIHDVGFRNLAKKDYCRAGKYLSRMVDLVLADYIYKVGGH